MEPPPQVQRIGRYEVVRKIATGGMAELFLARYSGPGGFEKRCALKRILPQFAADETFTRMFLTEAKITAQLDHPNIVQIFELGQDDNGQYFIAMEMVNGVNLRQLMTMADQRRQAIPPELAAYMATQALEGLAYAHELTSPATGEPLRLVHRDISPQNILVSYEGAVKLVDFGIVKGSTISGETQTGMLKGKVAYMSPEQATGEPLDARSDLFSLSVVLFELIAGARPFTANNELMMLKAILEEPPCALTDFAPECPEGIERAIFRGLAKYPQERFADARAFHLELDHVLRDCPVPLGRHVVSAYIQSLTEGSTVRFDAKRLKIPRRAPVGFASHLGRSPPPNLDEAGASDASPIPLAPRPQPHDTPAVEALLEHGPSPSWTRSGARPAGAGPEPTPTPSAGGGHGEPQGGGHQAATPDGAEDPRAIRNQRLSGAAAGLTPSPAGPGPRAAPETSVGGESAMGSIPGAAPGDELAPAELAAAGVRRRRWLPLALSVILGGTWLAVWTWQRADVDAVMVSPISPVPRVERVEEPAPLPLAPAEDAAPEPAERPPPPARPSPPPPPAKPSGQLVLSTKPSGLVVRAGKRRLGRTPLTTTLGVGEHRLLLVSRRRGIRRRLTVRIRQGETTERQVVVRTGTVQVVSRPWAEVFVDGRAEGKTPLTLTTYEGTHQLKLVGPDGDERIQSVRVKAGQNPMVRVIF